MDSHTSIRPDHQDTQCGEDIQHIDMKLAVLHPSEIGKGQADPFEDRRQDPVKDCFSDRVLKTCSGRGKGAGE